jgi:hypothetical protein
MIRIFFYGLFMDVSLLREKGLRPHLVGAAELSDYRIHVGNRATLIPSPGSTSYGMLIDLSEEDANELYLAPDVRDYSPDRVHAVLLSDRATQPSLCYNLAADKLGVGMDSEYADRLSALALQLGFPPAYASEITRRDDT